MKLGNKKEVFVHWYNCWHSVWYYLFGKADWNWYQMTFFQIELEDTAYVGSFNIVVILLGLGFRLEYSYIPLSDLPIAKELDDAIRKHNKKSKKKSNGNTNTKPRRGSDKGTNR